jgi:hypothetical protein
MNATLARRWLVLPVCLAVLATGIVLAISLTPSEAQLICSESDVVPGVLAQCPSSPGPTGSPGPPGPTGSPGPAGPQGRGVLSARVSGSCTANICFGPPSGAGTYVALNPVFVAMLSPAAARQGSNLAVELLNEDNVGFDPVVVTLTVNNQQTALSCTIPAFGNTCTNISASVPIPAGSEMAMRFALPPGAGNTMFMFGYGFEL